MSIVDRLRSDAGVYLLSGLFAVVVFVIGLVVLSVTLPGGLDRRRLFGFVIGFLAFVAVHVVALGIYHWIDAGEDV